ncbi:MAG: sce7726 family protein [Desulfobacteraceae bacterium]|nr:sce7726 family protein [Desulfobacteraceae bacterium]
MKMEQKYFHSVGRIFSPIVLDSLAHRGHSSYLTEICRNSGILDNFNSSITLREFLDRTYGFLFKNYRNEYIYKNSLVNKILLGRHSLNTSQMLTEFRVGQSKADIVLLNGTSTVYEIKSQYDSFARLGKQIESYFEIFDYINVIASPSQSEKLISILPDQVGVLVLTDRSSISTLRKPLSNKENIKLRVLFDSLRKPEYTAIIKEYYGVVPDVPNTQIHPKCKELFCKIPPDRAHKMTIKFLKKRNNSRLLKEFIEKAPPSIAAYAISACNEKNKMKQLLIRLDEKVNSLLHVPDGA